MPFTQLGLNAELIRATSDQGYTQPTAIQKQAIPVILTGRDLVAAAQTGTGKTAAFTLPILHLLSAQNETKHKKIKALILTPTRELAQQINENLDNYARHLPLSATVVFGGVNINPQIKRLKAGVDVLIATPGRLLDLAQQNMVRLSDIEIFVLDEADRMLDMGFIHDIRKIISKLPKQRQNLLFSATFSNEVKKISKTLLNDPAEISVNRQNSAAITVSHCIYPVERERKRDLLAYLIGSNNWRQVLVFVRTKHGAERLSKQLQKDGIRSASLHGNKSQHARNKALDYFKTGAITTLVATDIAARGLDIEQLPHVINFDLPAVAEDYVHRIGRTGRAGLNGMAISLVTQEDISQLLSIERLLKHKIKEIHEPGFETRLNRSQKPAPAKKADKKPSKPQHKNKPNPNKSSKRRRPAKSSGKTNPWKSVKT